MTGEERFERLSGTTNSDPSKRTPTKRDRDRILYSEAFRRLGGVTQVALGGPSMLLHNRLTHSLKVEQVGTSLFSKLSSEVNIDALANLDAVAAACLAHDLGHPPFGHAGEEELHAILVCDKHRDTPRAYDVRVKDPCNECILEDGFEGNAQSFRILIALAVHKQDPEGQPAYGLDLTRETLRATTKYPWTHGSNPNKTNKWGAYDCDASVLESLTGGDQQPTLSAQIMDWADDISYAVHDIEDFYRTGFIPFDQLKPDTESLKEFLEYVEKQLGPVAAETREVLDDALVFFPTRRFAGRAKDFAELDQARGTLLTQFINAATVQDGQLRIDEVQKRVNAIVKQFIWYHVIDDPRLTNIQAGQRRVLRDIFETLRTQVDETYHVGGDGEPSDSELRRLPHALRESISVATTQPHSGYTHAQAVHRGLVDYIAGLSDAQAYYEHSVLKGREPVGHL